MSRAVCPGGLRPAGLSVVIPTLERLAQVQRAMASVRCSRPDRVEIILVDDGSREDLRAHLPSVTEQGIKVRAYRFERNRGPQAARNLGIRRAKFSHIAFLDSDDSFHADKLDQVLLELDRRPFDLLFHGVEGMPRYARLAHLWLHCSGWLPFHWWLCLLNPAATPALVVRRERRLGLPRLRHAEDWCFLLHYVRPDTRVRYLDTALSCVDRPAGSGNGLSSARWRMRRGEFSARRVLLRDHAPGSLLRFAIGSALGMLRVLNDLLRRRYP